MGSYTEVFSQARVTKQQKEWFTGAKLVVPGSG